MIGWIFLAGGVSGTGACAYFVLRGRGVHRLVIPRSMLRAEAARHAAEAEDLACKLRGLASEFDGVKAERDDAKSALEKAGLRISDLEEQLRDADQLREANTALKAALDNRHAYRPLPVAADASALPDHLQEFADDTATVWRASA